MGVRVYYSQRARRAPRSERRRTGRRRWVLRPLEELLQLLKSASALSWTLSASLLAVASGGGR